MRKPLNMSDIGEYQVGDTHERVACDARRKKGGAEVFKMQYKSY